MIAIVVITHGRLRLLSKCVESVLGRVSDATTEIVVWDNASTDGTGEYLASLSDPRIRVVRSPEAEHQDREGGLSRRGRAGTHSRATPELLSERALVSLTYAIITPTRNEAEALPRLVDALKRQTRLPERWLIAENGSTDKTAEVATRIEADCNWARLLALPGGGPRERGAPIVRALHAALDALDVTADVVVNVDADVTMEPDYFERLLQAFEADPQLGIASGSAWEQDDGVWHQRFVTGGTVWGATRAYRWECLQDVLPLEERHGWDGIDQLKARARGWHTKTLLDLPFRHHRTEGREDGSSWAHWVANGDTAYFMGYRPWYLLMRTLHRVRRDRAAVGLVYGYVSAAVRRVPRLDDPGARAMLRSDQSFTKVLRRRREALGLRERTS